MYESDLKTNKQTIFLVRFVAPDKLYPNELDLDKLDLN